jgi:hypothetical protein
VKSPEFKSHLTPPKKYKGRELEKKKQVLYTHFVSVLVLLKKFKDSYFIYLFFSVMGIEPRTSCLPSTHYTIGLIPSTQDKVF